MIHHRRHSVQQQHSNTTCSTRTMKWKLTNSSKRQFAIRNTETTTNPDLIFPLQCLFLQYLTTIFYRRQLVIVTNSRPCPATGTLLHAKAPSARHGTQLCPTFLCLFSPRDPCFDTQQCLSFSEYYIFADHRF